MNPHPDEQLATSLLAEEARVRGPGVGSDSLLRKIVENELARERRVRRAAIASWSAVFVFAVLFGVGAAILSMVGSLHSFGMALYFAAPVLAFVAFVLGVLTTVAWLFRPRAASLAIIERRLADLEVLLRSGR